MKTTIEQIKVSDIPDSLQKNGFSSDEMVRISAEKVLPANQTIAAGVDVTIEAIQKLPPAQTARERNQLMDLFEQLPFEEEDSEGWIRLIKESRTCSELKESKIY
jgi:hypothetical protein